MSTLREREITGTGNLDQINMPAIQEQRAKKLNDQAGNLHDRLRDVDPDRKTGARIAMILLRAKRTCQAVRAEPGAADAKQRLNVVELDLKGVAADLS